ncbi:hypothetical protein EST38_g5 [Candolleomyces aberdarensis]|uniref:JmjC domain-containing protein n=1 Tax=Candolleomyces aberdarensis TaxID=2316362 RepID=A0A4Q2DYX0_9AGAR|nr:hypothetical protein EST38_g5 [Candolleomyces aberdarensis]
MEQKWMGPPPPIYKKQDDWWRGTNAYAACCQFIPELADLQATLKNFVKSCQSLKRLKVGADNRGPAGRAPSSTANTVAAEILAVGQTQRLLTRVKNFGYIALAICILSAGHIDIPEDLNQIDAVGSSLSAISRKARRIRQAFHLAVGISPICVLLQVDLASKGMWSEEILVNMKLLGNQKPRSIEALETLLWQEIFDVACGRQSAFDACLKVGDRLQESSLALEDDIRYFFRRGKANPYDPGLFFRETRIRCLPPHGYHHPGDADQPFEENGQGCEMSLDAPSDQSGESAVVKDKVAEERAVVVMAGGMGISLEVNGQGAESNGNDNSQEDQFFDELMDLDAPLGSRGTAAVAVEEMNSDNDLGSEFSDDDKDQDVPTRLDNFQGMGKGKSPDVAVVAMAKGLEQGVMAVNQQGKGGDGVHRPGAIRDAMFNSPTPQDSSSPAPDDESEDSEAAPIIGSTLPNSSLEELEPRRSGRLKEVEKKVLEHTDGSIKLRSNAAGRKSRRRAKTVPNESEEDLSDSDDLLLNYEDICAQDLDERCRFEKNIIVKIEQDEERESLVFEKKPQLQPDVLFSAYSNTKNEEFVFHDPTGRPHTYKPLIYDPGDYDLWTAIFKSIRVRFIDDEDSSLIRCLDQPKLKQLSVKDFQQLLRRQTIVLTDCSTERLEFDLQGLGRLADVDDEMDIQDQTIPAVNGNYQSRVCVGTLRDVYQAATSPVGGRKSLNALYMPNSHAPVDESLFATDVHAVNRSTCNDKHSIRKMPTADIRFNLAATEGAHHYFHIDSRGDGTWIEVLSGEKLWVIAAPKDRRKLSSTRLWTADEQDVAALKPVEDWDFEAVLLTPGTRLIMPPGTVHAAFSPSNVLCRGGHFLATTTMPATLFGAIHCFFMGHIITNIDAPSIQSRVNAMICYFYKCLVLGVPEPQPGYLPDILSRDGIEQLLATACLAELQNAICSLSYDPTNDNLWIWQLGLDGINVDKALDQYDVSAVPYASRLENIFSRGRACVLLKAVFSRVIIKNDNGEHLDGWNDLFIPMLAWLIVAIQEYSRRAFAKKCQGDKDDDEECDHSGENNVADDQWTKGDHMLRRLLSRQMEWTSRRWNELQEEVNRLAADGSVKPELLEWDMPRFTIQEKPGPWQRELKTSQELMHLGLRAGDQMFLRAYRRISKASPATFQEASYKVYVRKEHEESKV